MPNLTENQKLIFWDRVDRGEPEKCWPWTGPDNGYGYGFYSLERKNYKAHRIAFFISSGIDPGSFFVCHHCDNPPCCNPSHLFKGSGRQNAADMIAKGRKFIMAGENSPSRRYPESRPKGESHALSVLSDKSVQAIRLSYGNGGITQMELAVLFRVRQPTISAVIRKRIWKHIA